MYHQQPYASAIPEPNIYDVGGFHQCTVPSNHIMNVRNPSNMNAKSTLNKHITEDIAIHYFFTGEHMDSNSDSTSSTKTGVQITCNSTNKARTSSTSKMNRRKKTKSHQNRKYRTQSYLPAQQNRMQGNIQISRNMTKQIILPLIKEPIRDIYDYMDKCVAFCDSVLFMNGSLKIMNFNFHSKDTQQLLYCVAVKHGSEIKKRNAVEWRIVDQLFTAQDILLQYQVTELYLPRVRNCVRFKTELDYKRDIKYALMDMNKRRNIFESTKWCRVDVFNRVNNKKRLTLSVTKPEFIKSCNEFMTNMEDIKFIPIVMFSATNSTYWIEHVCVLRIAEEIDIGISFRLNSDEDKVQIGGIHLDKEYILRQHQLVFPQHDCDCLENFRSNIDDLKIGNPDDDQNRVKHYKKQVEELKKLLLKSTTKSMILS